MSEIGGKTVAMSVKMFGTASQGWAVCATTSRMSATDARMCGTAKRMFRTGVRMLEIAKKTDRTVGRIWETTVVSLGGLVQVLENQCAKGVRRGTAASATIAKESAKVPGRAGSTVTRTRKERSGADRGAAVPAVVRAANVLRAEVLEAEVLGEAVGAGVREVVGEAADVGVESWTVVP